MRLKKRAEPPDDLPRKSDKLYLRIIKTKAFLIIKEIALRKKVVQLFKKVVQLSGKSCSTFLGRAHINPGKDAYFLSNLPYFLSNLPYLLSNLPYFFSNLGIRMVMPGGTMSGSLMMSALWLTIKG